MNEPSVSRMATIKTIYYSWFCILILELQLEHEFSDEDDLNDRQQSFTKKTKPSSKWFISSSPVSKEMSVISAASNFAITSVVDNFAKETKLVIKNQSMFFFSNKFIIFSSLISTNGDWMYFQQIDQLEMEECSHAQHSKFSRRENYLKLLR